MKIINIVQKKDKNGNEMKILTMENQVIVFVNSKYEPEIYEAIEPTKDIEIVQDGKFWKVVPESIGIQLKPKGNYKTAQITEAVKIKGETIRQAQENKNDSIRMSSACRDASLMIATLIPFLYKDFSEEQLKEKWAEWRKFFFERLNDEPQSFSSPF